MSPTREPWWASGDAPEDVGTDDPFEAHRAARAGADWREELSEDIAEAERGRDEPTPQAPHWLGDAMDVLGRMAADATHRLSAGGGASGSGGLGGRDPADDHPAGRRRQRSDGGGATPPHPPGEVCNACPVCIGLRALRSVRPEVIGHLSDAAHHLSLALRAVADATADGPDHVERITPDDD